MTAPKGLTGPDPSVEDPPDIDETVWMARLIEVIAVACAVAFALARTW